MGRSEKPLTLRLEEVEALTAFLEVVLTSGPVDSLSDRAESELGEGMVK